MRISILFFFSLFLCFVSTAWGQGSVANFASRLQINRRSFPESVYQAEYEQFQRLFSSEPSLDLFKSASPALRYQHFKENYDFIHEHNTKANPPFTLGINQFADMSHEEYKDYLTAHARPRVDPSLVVGSHVRTESVSRPDSVDWRSQGIVNPVKNQGQCGSCWAFSAASSMEGAWAQATGELHRLSEQLLVDCSANGQNTCSRGGYMQDGFNWGIEYGMMAEKDYPYRATSGNPCKFRKDQVIAKFTAYVNVTSGDEEDLTDAGAKTTVAVAIDASSRTFQMYRDGVYVDNQCKSDDWFLNHGVTLVGYGTEKERNLDYYIIRNSWGATWGKGGYILMARNRNNMCGVATDSNYPIPF